MILQVLLSIVFCAMGAANGNNYKTVTSRLIRKNFSEQLKQYYWKPYFWSDSYFVCSVSDRTESAVKSYIDSQ